MKKRDDQFLYRFFVLNLYGITITVWIDAFIIIIVPNIFIGIICCLIATFLYLNFLTGFESRKEKEILKNEDKIKNDDNN
jgi:uncharacterized protein (DUF2062 family)